MAEPVEVVHIAGLPVTLHRPEGDYLRQRCTWCGALLIDYNLATVAVPAGQPGPGAWEPGKLVATIAGNPKIQHLVDDDGERLPDRCCARLDPEATV